MLLTQHILFNFSNFPPNYYSAVWVVLTAAGALQSSPPAAATKKPSTHLGVKPLINSLSVEPNLSPVGGLTTLQPYDNLRTQKGKNLKIRGIWGWREESIALHLLFVPVWMHVWGVQWPEGNCYYFYCYIIIIINNNNNNNIMDVWYTGLVPSHLFPLSVIKQAMPI